MTSFTQVDDPHSYLTPPSPKGTGLYMWQLRFKCGIVIGAVDGTVKLISGFSPLEEWVLKPLAGDWDAFDRGAIAWRNSGQSVNAVASNIKSLPGQVGDAWSGDAAEAWGRLQEYLAGATTQMPDACNAMGDITDALSEMAKAIAEYITTAIGYVADKVMGILVKAAIPVVGTAWAAADTVFLVIEIIKLGIEIAMLFAKFFQAVLAFYFAERMLMQTVAKIQVLVEMLEQAYANASGSSSASTVYA